MSHITKLETNIKFADEAVLKEALNSMGKVLEGTGAKTILFNEGKIKNLSFLRQGSEWIARADNWGQENEYRTLINKIQVQYQISAVRKILTSNRYVTTQKATNKLSGRRF